MSRFRPRREIFRRLQQLVIARERAAFFRNVLFASDDDSDSSNSDNCESDSSNDSIVSEDLEDVIDCLYRDALEDVN